MSQTNDPFDFARSILMKRITIYILFFSTILIFVLMLMKYGPMSIGFGATLIAIWWIMLVPVACFWFGTPIDWRLKPLEIKVYLERKPNTRDLIFLHVNKEPLWFTDLKKIDEEVVEEERKKEKELLRAKCQAEQLEVFKNA